MSGRAQREQPGACVNCDAVHAEPACPRCGNTKLRGHGEIDGHGRYTQATCECGNDFPFVAAWWKPFSCAPWIDWR